MDELKKEPPLLHNDGDIAVVACSYNLDPVELKNRLVRLSNRLGVKFYGVIVANRSAEANIADPRWKLLQGTNADLDFSAYEQGAEYWLNIKGPPPPTVLFINDSLFTSHSAIASLRATVRLLPLLSDIQLSALVGKVDRYTTICYRNPWSGLNFYISTYCFALNIEAVEIVPKLRKWAEEDGLSHTIAVQEPEWGSGLDPAFKEFLRANILYKSSPYRWRNIHEHRGNEILLRKKARCIYFEHRLSGELGKNAVIMPTNAGPKAQLKMLIYRVLFSIQTKFMTRLLRNFVTRIR